MLSASLNKTFPSFQSLYFTIISQDNSGIVKQIYQVLSLHLTLTSQVKSDGKVYGSEDKADEHYKISVVVHRIWFIPNLDISLILIWYLVSDLTSWLCEFHSTRYFSIYLFVLSPTLLKNILLRSSALFNELHLSLNIPYITVYTSTIWYLQ